MVSFPRNLLCSRGYYRSRNSKKPIDCVEVSYVTFKTYLKIKISFIKKPHYSAQVIMLDLVISQLTFHK